MECDFCTHTIWQLFSFAPQHLLWAARFLAGAMPNGKGKKSKSSQSLPDLDCEGFAEEWDSAEDIRSRLREGGRFIHPEAKADDVQGCCRNSSLLIPILQRMATVDGRPLPPIDPLRDQIDAVLAKNKRGDAPEEIDSVVKASWRLKKMCGFVKMKVRRGEVSTVAWHCNQISHVFFWRNQQSI